MIYATSSWICRGISFKTKRNDFFGTSFHRFRKGFGYTSRLAGPPWNGSTITKISHILKKSPSLASRKQTFQKTNKTNSGWLFSIFLYCTFPSSDTAAISRTRSGCVWRSRPVAWPTCWRRMHGWPSVWKPWRKKWNKRCNIFSIKCLRFEFLWHKICSLWLLRLFLVVVAVVSCGCGVVVVFVILLVMDESLMVAENHGDRWFLKQFPGVTVDGSEFWLTSWCSDYLTIDHRSLLYLNWCL